MAGTRLPISHAPIRNAVDKRGSTGCGPEETFGRFRRGRRPAPNGVASETRAERVTRQLEADAQVQQDVDFGDIAGALEDVAPGVAPFDAEAGEEGATAAGEFAVGVAGDEHAADDIGAVGD